MGTSFSGVITKQEIEAKSQEFDIHISNVEGDYVLDGFWPESILAIRWEPLSSSMEVVASEKPISPIRVFRVI